MKYEVIDQCAVPKKLAPAVLELKRKVPGAALNSCDRSKAAEPILTQYGKKSQRELYEGFIRGLPGFNPANKPGRSTHERRSDGVAYAGPAGRPLFPWQVGMDWNMPTEVLQAAPGLGYTISLTYKNSPREAQHLNFQRAPLAKRMTMLKTGDSGPRVQLMTRRLAAVLSPLTKQPYLAAAKPTFDADVEAAVRMFQTEHALEVDGVAGPQTLIQLKVAMRRQKKIRNERGGSATSALSADDRLVVRSLEQYGIKRPEVTLAEARRAGITVRLAASLLEQESGGGENVFGHDPVKTGQIVGGPVTKERYDEYRRMQRTGFGAQGVGPCQLTWPGFQDEADRLGGCWKPPVNMRVAFSNLKTLIDRYGWDDGIRRYNGSGPAADAYRKQVSGRFDTWTSRLKQEGVKL